MVKLVVKICAFVIILGVVTSLLDHCTGSPVDRFLSDLFDSSEEVKENYITDGDIANADPTEFKTYVNIQLFKYGQQYTSYNSTNVNILQEISPVNVLIQNAEQIIETQANYINKTTINQTVLLEWADENRTNKDRLEKQYNDLIKRLEILDLNIKELKTNIRSLQDAICNNSCHFSEYIEEYKEYNKNEMPEESLTKVISDISEDYNTLCKELNAQIGKLSEKVNDLSTELMNTQKSLRELNKSVEKCSVKIDSLNEKIDNLIEQSGRKEEDKTYYFIIDTEDELKSKGLVTSGGLFGGLKVTDNPDKDEFALLSEKDKTIMLGGEDMEFDVLSEMPADSYEYRVVNKVKVLIITDVDRFWSQTAFLIIKKSE